MGKSNDSIEIVTTDLEIEEELDAHRKGWAAQRVGLIFIFALVILAAAGVFGDGLASKNTISHDQITVESERFYRFEARMPIKVHVADVQTENGLTLAFPSHYLQNFRIESIQPEPKSNKIDDGTVSYTFEGRGSMEITFFLIPKTPGTIAGDLDVNGNIFALKHFIYP